MSSKRQDAFPYSENVQVTIQTGQTGLKSFYLPDVPNLRGKTIIGVEAYSVTATPVTPQGVAIINATDFTKSFITIVDTTQVQRVRQQPLSTLLRANNNGNWISVEELQMDAQKTYITFGGTGALTANEAWMFTFYYHN